MNKNEEDLKNALKNIFLIWDQNVPVLDLDIDIIRRSFIKWTEWLKKRDE